MGNSVSVGSSSDPVLPRQPSGLRQDVDESACPVSPEAREAWLRQAQKAKASDSSTETAQIGGTSAAGRNPQLSTDSCDSSRIDQSSSSTRLIGCNDPSQDQRTARALGAGKHKLRDEREISSIPRALPPDTAAHLSGFNKTEPASAQSRNGGETYGVLPVSPNKGVQEDRWIYPSESQFFSALVRKSHSPNPSDMKNVVPLHNAVNERTWALILQWEGPYTLAGQLGQLSDAAAGTAARGSSPGATSPANCVAPRLLSFSGDYSKLSPRARFRTLLGYQRPFDRHDWVVDRCGTRVEYLIDFYEGKSDPGPKAQAVNFFLDVRPKLNTIEGCKMRFVRFWGLEGWL